MTKPKNTNQRKYIRRLAALRRFKGGYPGAEHERQMLESRTVHDQGITRTKKDRSDRARKVLNA